MARSKKEAVAIKILAAKNALEDAIRTLEKELSGIDPAIIRGSPDLYKSSLRLIQHKINLEDIEKLFGTLKKKQSTRLILAVCMGELKNAEGILYSQCEYKIRASMSMFMRGVPCCPDASCTRKSKPMEVQIADDQIEDVVEESFNEVMTRAEKTLANDKAKKEGDPMSAEDEEFFKKAGDLPEKF